MTPCNTILVAGMTSTSPHRLALLPAAISAQADVQNLLPLCNAADALANSVISAELAKPTYTYVLPDHKLIANVSDAGNLRFSSAIIESEYS